MWSIIGNTKKYNTTVTDTSPQLPNLRTYKTAERVYNPCFSIAPILGLQTLFTLLKLPSGRATTMLN